MLTKVDWMELRNRMGDERINEWIDEKLLVPVERCEHTSEGFPNGRIDGHDFWHEGNIKWCPGAEIGGDE